MSAIRVKTEHPEPVECESCGSVTDLTFSRNCVLPVLGEFHRLCIFCSEVWTVCYYHNRPFPNLRTEMQQKLVFHCTEAAELRGKFRSVPDDSSEF